MVYPEFQPWVCSVLILKVEPLGLSVITATPENYAAIFILKGQS